MARSNKTNTSSTVTVHLEPEVRQIVDQTMLNFGLDGRSATIAMIIASWQAAIPENTMVYLIAQQATREIRKHLFDKLAAFFENEAKQMKGPS